MWSAPIAMDISSWPQALTGHDKRSGRAHGKRLRRELVCVAARVGRHARDIVVRPAPEDANGAFGSAWRALDALLAGGGPLSFLAAPGRPPRAPCDRQRELQELLPLLKHALKQLYPP